MALNRIQAARLLSAGEMALFEASLGDRAPQLSDRELRSFIGRLRTQREKFQDLLRRQRLSTRERSGTKSGTSGVANARTGQKVQVFSEALERLEKQQARRERRAAASERKAAATPARASTVRSAVRAALEGGKGAGTGTGTRGSQAGRSSKAPAPRRPAAGAGAKAAAQSPPTVPHAKRAQDMGQQRALAHVSARGRRQQARRDAG